VSAVTSITKFRVFLYLTYANLAIMSSLFKLSSGFWAIILSSIFWIVISSAMSYITSLGFLNFLALTVSLSSHFSLMSLVTLSMSPWFRASICTLPFLRVLSALIPPLISVGLMFDFSIYLIVSADLLSLEETVSIWCVCVVNFPPQRL